MTHVNLAIYDDEHARLLVDTAQQTSRRYAGEVDKVRHVHGGILTGRGLVGMIDRLADNLAAFDSFDECLDNLGDALEEAGRDFLLSFARESAEKRGFDYTDEFAEEFLDGLPDEISEQAKGQPVLVGYSPAREQMVMAIATYDPRHEVDIRLGGAGQFFTSEREPARKAMAKRGGGSVPTLDDQAAMIREQHAAWVSECQSQGIPTPAAYRGNIVAWEIRPDGAQSHVVGPMTRHAQSTKAGRNDACPCGSGRKYKKCCRLAEA